MTKKEQVEIPSLRFAQSPNDKGKLLRGYGRFGYGVFEVVERQLQSLLQLNLGFPSEQTLCFRDIRTPLLGIVLRDWFVLDLALRSDYFEHAFRALQDCELVWIADVGRQVFVRF